MSKILVFQHVAAEPLGTLDPLIRERGHRIRFINFGREPDACPDISRYDGLVVLGGPMNVEDQDTVTHLKTEIRLIQQALERNIPILGICLGAQLLATALGGGVKPASRPEIGWYSLNLTESGVRDPLFQAVPEQFPVFQWHSYTFELPSGAIHLAETAGCRNQAFRYGDQAYGFQFHLEMDEALIHRWLGIPAYLEDLGSENGDERVTEIEVDTNAHVAAMQQHAHQVFSRFLDRVAPTGQRIVLHGHS